ncbi:MAG: aerobic-type carbon monoxide dehydrogenase, middle subunit CoxM/CutM-like protein [Acidobacteria bacterium]|nr:aerobic-type carbon monoxide dehydrogenase, middle subunit CoxM/CutM-like protein [Acidobacteriota bacterium]
MLPDFSYVRPGTLDEAVSLLADGRSRVHGGGTDLLGCLRDRVFAAERLVSLRDLAGLRGIQETADGGLRIGALTAVAEIAEHETVRSRYRALAEAAASVASPQLRQQGTLGGNLCQKPRCWYYRGDFHCLRKGGDTCYAAAGENQYHCIFGGGPCFIVHPSDTAPALIVLGAAVQVVGPRGTRRVPLEEFYVLPEADVERETTLGRGEIVTAIDLPPAGPSLRSSYRKVRARGAWDFALVGMALALQLDGGVVRDARVAFSGVAPVPWRARDVESVLRGQRIDRAVVSRAMNAAVSKASPLPHNAYKVDLLRGLVEERLASIA